MAQRAPTSSAMARYSAMRCRSRCCLGRVRVQHVAPAANLRQQHPLPGECLADVAYPLMVSYRHLRAVGGRSGRVRGGPVPNRTRPSHGRSMRRADCRIAFPVTHDHTAKSHHNGSDVSRLLPTRLPGTSRPSAALAAAGPGGCPAAHCCAHGSCRCGYAATSIDRRCQPCRCASLAAPPHRTVAGVSVRARVQVGRVVRAQ